MCIRDRSKLVQPCLIRTLDDDAAQRLDELLVLFMRANAHQEVTVRLDTWNARKVAQTEARRLQTHDQIGCISDAEIARRTLFERAHDEVSL